MDAISPIIVKPKTSSVFEIDVYDTVLRDVKHLTTGTANDRMNVGPIWSRMGSSSSTRRNSPKALTPMYLWLTSRARKARLLTPHQGESIYAANDVSPDGKSILITSNAGNGYDNVGLLDIASKKIRWVTQDKWEISGEDFRPTANLLTYTANVDGNTDIYLYDIACGTGPRLPLPKGVNFPRARTSPFTHDGSRMLYATTGHGSRRLLGLHRRRDAANRSSSHNRWWAACAPKIWSSPSSFTIPSKDGKWNISAFVYVPYNLPRNGRSIPPSSTCTAGRPRRP